MDHKEEAALEAKKKVTADFMGSLAAPPAHTVVPHERITVRALLNRVIPLKRPAALLGYDSQARTADQWLQHIADVGGEQRSRLMTVLHRVALGRGIELVTEDEYAAAAA